MLGAWHCYVTRLHVAAPEGGTHEPGVKPLALRVAEAMLLALG